MKTLNKITRAKTIKAEALLSGMDNNPTWEIKDGEAEKVMDIYNTMQTGSYMNARKDTNSFYKGCMLELSSNKSVHVFDGYAILSENNIIEVRIDSKQKLEKQILKNIQTAPMIKNLIFNSELSRNIEIHKAV